MEKLSDFEEEIIKKTFELPADTILQVDDESLKNAGFCSTLKTVSLNGQFDVILKSAPIGNEIRELIPFGLIFQREVYFYEVVISTFKQLQKEYNIKEIWNCVPKCFSNSKEPFKECLVLENLKVQGFQLWPRGKEMDSEHVKLVLKEYSRFHAFSFALRTHKPEALKTIEDNTNDIYLPIIKKCGTADTIRKLSDRVWAAFDKNRCSFPVIEIMEQLVAQGAAGQYGVLCHGDTWCNNILFNKNSSNRPADIKLLDFQLARFGSPVLDLSYFLYCSSSLDDLNNLDMFLKHYHEELTRFLKQFNCDASLLFSYEVLEEHWKKFAYFGLGMAFLVVNVMMMDDSELPDVNDNKVNGDDFIGSFEKKSRNDGGYLEKMLGILKHFQEKGLLQ